MSQQALSASSSENSAQCLEKFFQIIGWPRNGHNYLSTLLRMNVILLKGLSYEIDFENVDENWQILALTRAAAGFWIFQSHL
jgi:hypothetical protein